MKSFYGHFVERPYMVSRELGSFLNEGPFSGSCLQGCRYFLGSRKGTLILRPTPFPDPQDLESISLKGLPIVNPRKLEHRFRMGVWAFVGNPGSGYSIGLGFYTDSWSKRQEKQNVEPKP